MPSRNSKRDYGYFSLSGTVKYRKTSVPKGHNSNSAIALDTYPLKNENDNHISGITAYIAHTILHIFISYVEILPWTQ